MLARSHSVGYHQETSVTTSLSTIGPGVAMTTSCPINRTPIINVNYPLTTGNLNTNRLPIIGHSTSTSGKNKMTSVSLPLPVCTTNSTVKNLNGSQQQEVCYSLDLFFHYKMQIDYFCLSYCCQNTFVFSEISYNAVLFILVKLVLTLIFNEKCITYCSLE